MVEYLQERTSSDSEPMMGRQTDRGMGAKFAQEKLRPGAHAHQHQKKEAKKRLDQLSLEEVALLLRQNVNCQNVNMSK